MTHIKNRNKKTENKIDKTLFKYQLKEQRPEFSMSLNLEVT